jgi:hypothetical protein
MDEMEVKVQQEALEGPASAALILCSTYLDVRNSITIALKYLMSFSRRTTSHHTMRRRKVL